MGSTTDPKALAEDLNRTLPLLARDGVALAMAAATLPGAQGIGLGAELRVRAADNLRDLERIAARIMTLGGTPAVSVESMKPPKAFDASVKRLLNDGQATLDALVEAIPADADDAEGEATEHLLEHIVARKREELELLERALR